jgi:Ca-activated chloride channel homolog
LLETFLWLIASKHSIIYLSLEQFIMKRFFLLTLIIFSLVSISLAQSGRRTKPASTGSTQKQTDTTENSTTKAIEPTGFSETRVSEPLSVALPRRKKKSNDKKKDSKETKVETPKPDESGEEVIKVDTTLISIPVTISQKNGSYIPSLSKQNFQIFEDGKEQEIAYFNSTDKPFTAVLVIDVSQSTALKIEQIQNGALAFVEQLLPEDKVMVISFDASVYNLLEFSSDKAAIEKAIRKIRFGGGTSLYDAVETSLGKKLQKIEGKKAVILFTDGVDSTSFRANYRSTLADAAESEAVIFPIYLNTFLDLIGIGNGGNGPMSAPSGIPGGLGSGQIREIKEAYATGRRYLQDLASATGGRVFRPENSENSLIKAFAGIAEELRSQYEVGYYSNNESVSGDVKQIKIRVSRPNLIIRNRDSYVVK